MRSKTRNSLVLFFIACLLILIAGVIMLTVGIIYHNEHLTCDVTTSNGNSTSDSAVFGSSHVPDIKWDPRFAETNSDEFKRVKKQIEDRINHALEQSRRRRTLPTNTRHDKKRQVTSELLREKKPRVIVNKIEKNPEGGVNVYTTLIFPDGFKNEAEMHDVVNSLNNEGLNSHLFGDPLAQCQGTPKGPPGGALQGSSTPGYSEAPGAETMSTICFTASPTWPTWPSYPTTPSGGPPGPPSPTYGPGITCDVGGRKVATIIVVDVAAPNIGTLDTKLANISALLLKLPYSINLPDGGSSKWPDGVTFQLVTYVDGQAHQLGEPCANSACWRGVISQMNNSAWVNPSHSSSHNLATGLDYILKTVIPAVPSTQARSVITILDSFDLTGDGKISSLADALKHNHYCVISALQIGVADSIKARLQPVVSDGTHYYVIPSFEWITNPTVVEQIDHWICDARLPTPQQPLTEPTPPGLITTQPPSTVSPPTEPTNIIKANECALDVLFLVDESQSMLDYGYHIAMDMVRQLTEEYSRAHNGSRFALVTFNSALVFTTHRYLPKATFYEAISEVKEVTGATYFELGFDAARTVIKGSTSRRNREDVRSLIVFFSDGANGNGTVDKVVGITRDLRDNLETQILAIGLNATEQGQRLTKEVLAIGQADAVVQSSYFNMRRPEPDDKFDPTAEAYTYALRNVHCKGEDICTVDLTFVIEVSETELTENVEVQKAAVASVIHHFRQNFGPFKARASLIFFSAPQGLQLSEYERSGIDDPAVAFNLTVGRHYILGGASDLKLAMQLTRKLLDENDSGNDQLVIVMARGEYRDGQAINCCEDPSAAAAGVREKAKMQGVVIGGFPNKPLLDTFTESESIDGNSLVSSGDIRGSGRRIAQALVPIIEDRQRNAVCREAPNFVLPCQEIVDLIIAVHASTPDAFNTTKFFISRELLPGIFGGRFSALPQARTVPVNIAIVVYSTLGSSTVVRLSDHVSQSNLTQTVERLRFPGAGKSRTMQAFGETKRALERSRPGASTVLLMFSDDVDVSDIPQAITFREKELNKLSYIFGVFVSHNATDRGLLKQVVGHGILLSTIDQLNLRARRSARNYANQIARTVCRYSGPDFVTTPHSLRMIQTPTHMRRRAHEYTTVPMHGTTILP